MAHRDRRAGEEMAQEGTLLPDDPGFLRQIVERVLQELLEAEMTEQHVGAAPYERSARGAKADATATSPEDAEDQGGHAELPAPRDREGTFSTRLFPRYQRNEKALVLALMEMYVEGVSTRKIKDVTEELCGTSFSESTVSHLAARLDAELAARRARPLEAKAYPYPLVAPATRR